MKIAVTGSSGLIGSALVPALREQGHEVVRLVRRTTESADQVSWDPRSGQVDLDSLKGTDAVVHLAGAGVGDHRWTPKYQQVILQSRTEGTTTISKAIAALDPTPSVLLSGSAIGWYGDTGDQAIDEAAPGGTGFLADVVRQWEASTAEAEQAGTRVVHLRTGLVLSGRGGALARMLPFARAGLAGRLGTGRQYWSWISLDDEVRAIIHLLTAQVTGPINLTGPVPVTNAELTTVLGHILHRPTILPAPAFALHVALGGFASDILSSQRVLPRALVESGFVHRHPDVESALRATVGLPR